MNKSRLAIDEALKRLGLRRHKLVGKKIGTKIWFHIDYIFDFIPSLQVHLHLKSCANYNMDSIVVRYDTKTEDVCFIESADFNESDEPIVGRSLLLRGNKPPKLTTPSEDPLIYHHKWMFVKDDYQGFDVEQSKQRSIWWKSQMGKDRYLSNRIGRLSFWQSWIKTLEQ